MSDPSRSPRATSAKIAKWLVERARVEEAIQILCAFAAQGPNDVEGQQLLAEALRIDPASLVARQAFERMEGIQGDHALLDQAIKRWSKDEIARFEREMQPASFRKAQVGFNNNVKYSGQVFHVQTEDSGLDKPHIITHLFADGGRVIKTHKRNYNEHVRRPDVALYVRALMKGQHMEMLLALREGKFDEVIAGRARGGIEVFEHPPDVDVKRVGRKKDAADEAAAEAAKGHGGAAVSSAQVAVGGGAGANAAAAAAGNGVGTATAPSLSSAAAAVSSGIPQISGIPQTTTAPAKQPAGVPSSADTRARARGYFIVQRSLVGGPERYAFFDGEMIIGEAGHITLHGEIFCHPREAAVRWRDGKLWLEDLEGGNGVFLRIRSRVELSVGDEFIIGDELFRVEKNPVADDQPEPDPTYFYSSPKWPSSFRVVQIFEGGALGACAVSRGGMVQIGSAIGDIVCPNDPLVSEQHCVLEEQAGVVVLTDLDSRTGVFVRLQGEGEIAHGDEILIGRTRLLVDLGATGAGAGASAGAGAGAS